MDNKTWYTREEAETSTEYGSIPENRSVEELLQKGVVMVDKPYGPPSKQVSTWVKKELNLKKAGHFGTLDPNATGVLPIGINKGTRVSPTLTKSNKEYIFEAKLKEEKPEQEIRKKLENFKGTNTQTPPEKSAVKKQERQRQVYQTELLEKNGKNILGQVKCESGFYVRVLIKQLGEKLETKAKMEELRRTQQGPIKETETHTLQEIVDAYHFYKQDKNPEPIKKILKPIEKTIQHLPKIAVKDSAVNAVANGANLGAVGISKLQEEIKQEETVAITTLKGELIALATAKMNSEQLYNAKEGEAATLQTVHMKPETYPKRWKQ